MKLEDKIRAARDAANEGDDELVKSLLNDIVETLDAPALAQGKPEFNPDTPAPWLGLVRGEIRDYDLAGFVRVEPVVGVSHTAARVEGGGFTAASQYPARAPKNCKAIVVPDLPLEQLAGQVAARSLRLGTAGRQMAYISLWSGLINTAALIDFEREMGE